jgi:hypothetical protein
MNHKMLLVSQKNWDRDGDRGRLSRRARGAGLPGRTTTLELPQSFGILIASADHGHSSARGATSRETLAIVAAKISRAVPETAIVTDAVGVCDRSPSGEPAAAVGRGVD